MNREKAEETAKKIIKDIVDKLSEKRYDDILKIAESKYLDPKALKDLIEGYVTSNGLSGIDKYDSYCFGSPNPAYKLSITMEADFMPIMTSHRTAF